MVGPRTPLLLRYFIWGMLIFAISMSLWGFRILRAVELDVPGLPLRFRSSIAYRSLQVVDLPLVSLPVYGVRSDEFYFEMVQDIVHRLSRARAKAVIIPVPSGFAPTPRTLRAIESILADSIAILGVPNPVTFGVRPNADMEFHRKNLWWVEHPLHNQRKIQWGVLSAYSDFQSPLIRFIPLGFREARAGGSVPDAAVIALRKYLGIPPEESIQPFGARIQMGSYPIFLSKDGISYLRNSFRPKLRTLIVATSDALSDSIHYFGDWGTRELAGQPLDKLWPRHEGKIVLIDPNFASLRWTPFSWLYTQVFGAIFQQSFLSVHQEWNVLLISTLILLLSVFSYTMRNSLTILLALALFIGVIALSIWLFDARNILFDPLYALVPIILCGTILPIVKTSGEKKLAEAAIKELQEENRRLTELQRRSAQHPDF